MKARWNLFDGVAAVVLALLVIGTVVRTARSSCERVRETQELNFEERAGQKFWRDEMAPVPEPPAYGIAAAGLVVAVVLLKRIRER
jgi:hypothetical protein